MGVDGIILIGGAARDLLRERSADREAELGAELVGRKQGPKQRRLYVNARHLVGEEVEAVAAEFTDCVMVR